MSIEMKIREFLHTLVPRGWGPVLLPHGLDLEAGEILDAVINKQLVVDRSQPGFEDACGDTERAIHPGSPAKSLLYHALACPGVHPVGSAGEEPSPDQYPTLEELDLVENFIWSLTNRSLEDFTDPEIVIFAYQYRRGDRSHHGRHADMAYSRTGVARVGTVPQRYDRALRSFRVDPESGKGIAVLPARFGAFIAERRSPGSAESLAFLQRPLPGASIAAGALSPEMIDARDREHTFLIPRHKLFVGDDCLSGVKIRNIRFDEFHINEKLHRCYHPDLEDNPGVLQAGEFNVNDAPFIRNSGGVGDRLVDMIHAGATGLLIPKDYVTLVRAVKQEGRTVTFRVPREKVAPRTSSTNRFRGSESTMMLPSGVYGRAAPEYLHIRSGLTTNLNSLGEGAYEEVLARGMYEAIHYTDDTAEGVVSAKVEGLPLSVRAAYSLVTAVDFLPGVDQIDLQRWYEKDPKRGGRLFQRGDFRPLSYSRYTHARRGPNPHLRTRDRRRVGFPLNDSTSWTATSVLGGEPGGEAGVGQYFGREQVSFLPDAASDIFAPGWDVAAHGSAAGQWFSNYGLGSPFPEDAKLCAALASYWPAAAPDAGRTFPEFGGRTSTPMLDVELGYHPSHPEVVGGKVASAPGWDGEYGPYFVGNHEYVNFARINRSDYTLAALNGTLSSSLLSHIDTKEMLARMEAFLDALGAISNPSQSGLLLVVAKKIGGSYVFEFAEVDTSTKKVVDVKRAEVKVRTRYWCKVNQTTIGWSKDGGATQQQAR